MKILFLDFDGVLNSISSALVWNGYDTFDPKCVGLVQRLVTQTKAKIVVSSSWRIGRTRDELLNDIAKAGGTALLPSIIGVTPLLNGDRGRGDEIASWLDINSKFLISTYVIVDDDSDMLSHQPFVKTSHAHGFTLNEYLSALEILAPNHQDLMALAHYKQPLQGGNP